jgi:hypothetical protein
MVLRRLRCACKRLSADSNLLCGLTDMVRSEYSKVAPQLQQTL